MTRTFSLSDSHCFLLLPFPYRLVLLSSSLSLLWLPCVSIIFFLLYISLPRSQFSIHVHPFMNPNKHSFILSANPCTLTLAVHHYPVANHHSSLFQAMRNLSDNLLFWDTVFLSDAWIMDPRRSHFLQQPWRPILSTEQSSYPFRRR